MEDLQRHIINDTATVKQGLEKLNSLPTNLTLFVINENNKLIGTVTDGDIRRALLKDISTEDTIERVMQKNFLCIKKNKFTLDEVNEIRKRKIFIIPIVNNDGTIVKIINLEQKKSLLPIDAFLVAGGEGRRLKPLTDTKPKPLLQIGNKPIIAHNTSRLEEYGVENIIISVKYLSEQIEEYYEKNSQHKTNIAFVKEDEPLGTIGAITLVSQFNHDVVLVMNSDLLTNIDYEDFYHSFITSNADAAVATTSYNVNIPYAVVETEHNFITALKEKPTYTYYSNAGIYLFKKELLQLIPNNTYFNATDLMEKIISLGKKIYAFPILDYWLDIGRPEDFEKAKIDILHLKF